MPLLVAMGQWQAGCIGGIMGGRWWVLALVVARVGRGGTPHSSEGNCSPALSIPSLVCLWRSDIILVFFTSDVTLPL